MFQFAGWEMPLTYTGIIEEHRAVRTKVGLFDVSHMGQITVSGPGAISGLNRLTVNDVARLAIGQVQYSALCLESGGVIDDLTVYRLGEESFLLCVNAANREKDHRWLRENLHEGLEVKDRSFDYCLLALQGPLAQAALEARAGITLSQLKYYWAMPCQLFGVEALVSRTGYTGEDGFEIYFAPASALELWDNILKAGEGLGIRPVGLGARDTLRIEMKYPLYGQELTETTSLLEAGLGWIIKWDKGEFVGKEFLLAQKKEGVRRKLVGFELLAGGVPRAGNRLVADEKEIGWVTSGTFSPSLQKGIGIGYVSAELAQAGQNIEVEIRGKYLPAKVVTTPFYKGGSIVK